MSGIELLYLRALPAVHERHENAVAAGLAQTGEATVAFYLAIDGSIQLPPGVHLAERALGELQRLAQTAESWRLQQPATRSSWHAAGAA